MLPYYAPEKVHDTYGEPYGPTGTPQTVLGFTGEETDGSGLVYLRARYYNPMLGVFPSLDPLEGNIQNPSMLNRYVYVVGNPANLIDPSGKYFWSGRGMGRETMEDRGRPSYDNVHVRIQTLWMELLGERIVHAEYPVPVIALQQRVEGNNIDIPNFDLSDILKKNLFYIDLMNEMSGEIWEIKPEADYKEGKGLAQVNAQVTLMNVAAGEKLLRGTYPTGEPYDWTWAPSPWLHGSTFPSQEPLFLGTDEFGRNSFYAQQRQIGIIVWWVVTHKAQVVYAPIPLPRDLAFGNRNRHTAYPERAQVGRNVVPKEELPGFGPDLQPGYTPNSGLLIFGGVCLLGAAATLAGGMNIGGITSACFTAETLVWLANNSTKPIGQIQVGDVVVARDENSGVTSVQRVLRVWKHNVPSIIEIHFENGEIIKTTPAHRFAVKGKGFLAASQLSPEYQIMIHNGCEIQITKKEVHDIPSVVYNLTVENFHTYFVGQSGAWVHNIKDNPTWALGSLR